MTFIVWYICLTFPIVFLNKKNSYRCKRTWIVPFNTRPRRHWHAVPFYASKVLESESCPLFESFVLLADLKGGFAGFTASPFLSELVTSNGYCPYPIGKERGQFYDPCVAQRPPRAPGIYKEVRHVLCTPAISRASGIERAEKFGFKRRRDCTFWLPLFSPKAY